MPKMFTEAARAAARVSRIRRAKATAELKALGGLEVFAVRLHNGFTWQVRQFGGLVLASGQHCFPSSVIARTMGLKMLTTMRQSTLGKEPLDAALMVKVPMRSAPSP